MPPAVLYKATEIPRANWATSWPVAVNAPNSSTMPITVPSRPSNGLTVAMVPSVVKYLSSLCATLRPDSSMDSFRISRDELALPRALAKISPRSECFSSRRNVSLVIPPLASHACTSGNSLKARQRYTAGPITARQ